MTSPLKGAQMWKQGNSTLPCWNYGFDEPEDDVAKEIEQVDDAKDNTTISEPQISVCLKWKSQLSNHAGDWNIW